MEMHKQRNPRTLIWDNDSEPFQGRKHHASCPVPVLLIRRLIHFVTSAGTVFPRFSMDWLHQTLSFQHIA